ncbi:SDR family NAD(P)-dependent oxidoreductase [Weissella cibaria]|uniref:SDR family NAD(P)-dependent oxidoreductase n=1 Tax=Weissella cibaria TaxID=137591 RepID=UPI001FD653D8|nr:SDR family NAD(P)-dependent oxidoreductase [Weissella cibaria]
MKTIVITGGSGGIGVAAAQSLVDLGHQVVIVGRNPTKTAAVANALKMPYHSADFTKLADVQLLANELQITKHVGLI